MSARRCLLFAGALALGAGGAASAQDFSSAEQIGPAGVTAVAPEPDGGLVAVGYFPGGGPSDFDPGPGVVTLTGSGRDAFVLRLDAAGELLWVRQLAASGDEANAIAVTTDASGDVYVTGSLDGSADFDPDPGNTLTLGSSFAVSQIFVWKLTASGDLGWARVLSPSAGGQGTGIGVDGGGNVWVAGWFRGACDFDPGAPLVALTSAGLEDVFVLELDAAAEYVRAGRMGGSSSDQPHGLVLDGQGRPLIAGSFNGSADFDPGAGTVTLTGNGDPFVVALATDGSVRWARQLVGGDFWDDALGIAATAGDGVVVVGNFRDHLDLDPGPGSAIVTTGASSHAFVDALDADGAYLWGAALGGNATSSGLPTSNATAVAVGPAGDVYLTGDFRQVADFDLGAGTFELSSAGRSDDAFVLALSPAGAFRWAASLGGGAGNEIGTAILVRGANQVVTFGAFTQPGDYDPGVGSVTLTPNGAQSFVSRLTDAFATPVTRHVPADFATIQAAIDGARHRDTILVAAGTYVENLDFHGQHVVLRSEGGPEVTVLDGNFAGPVVTFRSGEDSTTVLEGFTVRNGVAGPPLDEGGGISIAGDASPTIRGNRITGNVAGGGGAGIMVRTGTAHLVGNEITGNAQAPGWTGGLGGGGIAVIVGAPLIEDNTIRGNAWNDYGLGGGGISISGIPAGFTYVDRNRILDNHAPSQGGGITVQGALAVLDDNLIAGNTSSTGGGVYAAVPGPNAVYLIGNTLADNVAKSGGQVYLAPAGPALLANNVLANGGIVGAALDCESPDHPPILHSNVLWGGGSAPNTLGDCGTVDATNLTVDPLFLDVALGDYRLSLKSPAIDHGDNEWIVASADGPEWDLEKHARRYDEPDVPDGGIGDAPIVDMGAYESKNAIFADGLELLGTSAWSATTP